MERAETIIAACRDTMLTTLEKIGGQSLICSWTRQDGSVVKLALEIRTSDQTTIGDAIRDMDDEEMARKLVPAVLALCDDGAPSRRYRPRLAGTPAKRSQGLKYKHSYINRC